MKDNWKKEFDKEFDHWPNCDGYDSEGNCNCGFTQVRDFISSLLSSQLKEVEKYHELIMAVGNKYEGETRHETALRYIKQAEEERAESAELSQLAEGEK